MATHPISQKPFHNKGFSYSDGFGDQDVRVANDELSRMKKKKRATEIGDPILHAKTLEVKKLVTAIRRKEFNAKRNRLLLALIAGGTKYICSHKDCTKINDLHVDHITPLSLGGSDDVENLQFLCHEHNSKKGTKS